MPRSSTSFAPGRSGNPGGRPKGPIKEMSAYARSFGTAGIARLAEMAGLAPGKMAEAENAQIAAIKELLDRGYGKATQVLAGDDERPLAIAFEWAPAVATPAATVDTDEHTTIDAQEAPLEIVWNATNEC